MCPLEVPSGFQTYVPWDGVYRNHSHLFPKSFTFLLYFLNVFHVFKNTGSVLVSKYGFNKLPQNQWT